MRSAAPAPIAVLVNPSSSSQKPFDYDHVQIRADDADMVEGLCVGCEWRHALETDDDVVAGTHGNVKDRSRPA